MQHLTEQLIANYLFAAQIFQYDSIETNSERVFDWNMSNSTEYDKQNVLCVE